MTDEFDLLDRAEPVTSDSDDSIEGSIQNEFERMQPATSDDPFDDGDQADRDFDLDDLDEEIEDEENDNQEIPTIRPQLHEFSAHLLFADDLDGLTPYFAIVKQFEPDMLDTYGSFEFEDETWSFDEEKTKYWNGGIAAPHQSFETFNEYQINVYQDTDTKQKKINLQFRPSIPDARKTNGNRIESMPEDMPKGIRVQFSSSNVDREDIIPLIHRVVSHIGITPEYFDSDKIHEWSRVYQLAHYVRIDRDLGEQHVVNRGALMDRLSDLVPHMRGRGDMKWDNEEVKGHRIAIATDAGTWTKLKKSSQRSGQRLKYYHPKHSRSESTAPDDDALRDPKLEQQFSTEYTHESVDWSDVEELENEIESSLLNAIYWSGLPLRADPRVYRADDYFDASEQEIDSSVIVEDPTEQLKEQEQDLAVAEFARTDASTGERKVIDALTDGGDQHVHQLAENAGVSRSTVYRAINKFDDVLELANGHLSFADQVIRDKFAEMLGVVEDAMDWVRGGVRQLADRQDGFLDDDSPLAMWARRNGVAISESVDGMVVDLGGKPLSYYDVFKLLRSGVDAAEESGRHSYEKFKSGVFSWTDENGDRRSGQRPINKRGRVLGA